MIFMKRLPVELGSVSRETMELLSGNKGTAYHVLQWLSSQTSSYNHEQWFTSKEDRLFIQKPSERYYSMWEEATPEQRAILEREYCQYSRVPVEVLRASPFREDMKRLQRMCMLLNDPVKRKLLIERLVTDPNTGKPDASMALHFEARYLNKEVYQLRACMEGNRSLSDMPYQPSCPIRFMGYLDKTFKQRLERVDPLEWI